MNLLDSEDILLVADKDKLTITTHRVRYEYTNPSLIKRIMLLFQGEELSPSQRRRNYISIFLEQISSVEYVYKSRRLWGVLAIVFFFVSMFFFVKYIDQHREESIMATIGGFFSALVFVVLYLLSRRHYILVRTAGGVASVVMKKIAHRSTVSEIVDSIELAKYNRVMYLHGLNTAKPTAAVSKKKTCVQCGTPNAQQDTFCMNCGAKL